MSRVCCLLYAACLVLVPVLNAQGIQSATQPATQPGTQPPQTSSTNAAQGTDSQGAVVLHASTQLVLVDVLVRDRNGHPVHGLTRDSFLVTEDKSAQTLRSFEEFSSAGSKAAPGPELARQPAGVFTDYQPVPASGPLDVLLVDALNTPTKDQAYLREQLQRYVERAPAGTRIAIFGLNARLTILQGFTSDPAVLREAIDHKLGAKTSVLLDDSNGTNADPTLSSGMIASMNEARFADLVANVQQFEGNTQAYQNQVRIQYTIDNLNALGHYLSAFPGRKNLIWFSGSFPINILPDPELQYPNMVVEINDPEFREMTNLLARAQVAVYPIDARGVISAPMFDAARSGSKYVATTARSGGEAFGKDLGRFNSAQADEHSTMNILADQTGGQAFFNTNGLADAVASALDSGANYYALSYTPHNENWNGNYRNIHVELSGSLPAQGYTLSYRKGYYADDPDHPAPGKETATATAASGTPVPHISYFSAAMSRGAPTPEELLFKVRVLPASKETEASVVSSNKPAQDGKMQGPFHRYNVDFLAVPQEFTLPLGADGRRSGTVQFLAFVLDSDGHLLNTEAKTAQLHLAPASYASLLQNGMRLHLEVSAPAKGATYLRIAVHDMPSHRMGVVEVPVAAVSGLAPVAQ